MGLPVKHRKKYVSHKKRWDKSTITSEEVLIKDYALKNKKEIRKIEFMVSKLKRIAKTLNKDEDSKNSAEASNFISKLKAKGFLPQDAEGLDSVLDISVRDILERRLSNLVYKHKLARSSEQARQFVVHRHVRVGDKVITSPSYLVTLQEESEIQFRVRSSLADESHPERRFEEMGIEKELEEQTELKSVKESQNEKQKISSQDKKEAELDDEENEEVEK